MRLVASSTGQVEYSTGNSILIQTSHFTCAELNALIMLSILHRHSRSRSLSFSISGGSARRQSQLVPATGSHH